MTSAQSEIPDILESVGRVVRRARRVTIDEDAIRRWAVQFGNGALHAHAADDPLMLNGSREECANFALMSDALNFCFWSDEPWEVEYQGHRWTRTFAMLAGLRRAIERDRSWLSAACWAQCGDAEVATLFRGQGTIPLPAQRGAVLRETGAVLEEQFGGHFRTLVTEQGGDAGRIAYRLAQCFPSFRDVSHYDGEPVAFLKRAQICAADLHRLWRANGFAGLDNLEALTVFADYRLPQLFRNEGMLRLDEELAQRIDRGELIEAGSPEEVEIRAATVWIGKLLCEALRQHGRAASPWEVDYELWLRAKAPEVAVPHHRTVTCFY